MAQRVEHHSPSGCRFCGAAEQRPGWPGEALRILDNEASRIERNHFLNAQPHERTAERTDYANGFKSKSPLLKDLVQDVHQTVLVLPIIEQAFMALQRIAQVTITTLTCHGEQWSIHRDSTAISPKACHKVVTEPVTQVSQP